MFEIKTKADAMRATNALVGYIRACEDDEFVDWIRTNIAGNLQFMPWEIEDEAEQEEIDAALRESCNFNENEEGC